MKTKLTVASLIILFLSTPLLTSCAGPVAGGGDAAARQRAAERQEKRAHRRMYGLDGGFTGNYGR